MGSFEGENIIISSNETPKFSGRKLFVLEFIENIDYMFVFRFFCSTIVKIIII